jgi:hypothetical protein
MFPNAFPNLKWTITYHAIKRVIFNLDVVTGPQTDVSKMSVKYDTSVIKYEGTVILYGFLIFQKCPVLELELNPGSVA